MTATVMPRMYLESIEVQNQVEPLIYCPDPRAMGRYLPVSQPRLAGTLRLAISMDYTEGAKLIIDQMRQPGGFAFGVERKEWRCIYCGVANPIPSRFCSQCGGPRGWLM